MENNKPGTKRAKRPISAYIMAILGLLYAIMPLDIIPDTIPIAGWIDDAFVLASTLLNLFHKELEFKTAEDEDDNGDSVQSNAGQHISTIIKYVKWAVIAIGIVVIVVLAGGIGAVVYAISSLWS